MTPENITPLPPHNETSEKGLLGCCLFDGQNISKAFDFGIRPEAFYDLKNREIWHHLRVMEAAQHPIDLISFTQFLQQQGALTVIGGPVYLTECLEQAPVGSNIDYHLKLVMEKWSLRLILSAATIAASQAVENEASPENIIGTLSEKLDKAKCSETATSVVAKDTTLEWVDSVETRQDHRTSGKELIGLPTGFRKLDFLSSGLPTGGLTVIASRPSVGKTAMLCNIIQYTCIENGTPTTVFSLETTRSKLIDRLAANACNIAAGKFRDGDPLSEQEMQRVTHFAGKLAKSPLTFAKNAFDLGSICSLIDRQADMGHKLFLVDYIQIVGTSNRGRNEPRTYSVGSVATTLKQIAIKHNVTIVALAQLKRTDDESTLPNSNDIADSDQIFRDADLMWLIHRPERLQKPTEGSVIVAKNKDGEIGYVPMVYTPYLLRWEERKENPHTA